MGKQSDRNTEYMRKMWGTNRLTSDYGAFSEQKMLREINHDDYTPKRHDFAVQNEIHEKIRNDNDYDDWEYGTEPLYQMNK